MRSGTVSQANSFIESHKETVNTLYKNDYHVTAPIGWINDPNGFVYYKGEYHLFYQYYPYDSVWGPMHWGHTKSRDLIHWEELPVALAPDQSYDCSGCFSGSAIVKDDQLYLMYTGHQEIQGKTVQTQCLAYSSDGIHFEKSSANPLITAADTNGVALPQDFRDPKVFKRDHTYYSVVASKTIDDCGQILLFQSQDLIHWEYVSVILTGKKDQGIMWECPDLFALEGKDVLIISPIQIPKQGDDFHNISSSLAFIGKMDWEKMAFKTEKMQEIDRGLDFYAPQTCLGPNQERIMMAWMQLWGRNIPSHELGHLWAGSMTLPRILSLTETDVLQQQPAPSIYENLQKKVIDQPQIISTVKEWQNLTGFPYWCVEFDELTDYVGSFTLKLGSDTEYVLLTYQGKDQLLTIDRSQSGYAITGDEPSHLFKRTWKLAQPLSRLECFKDKSSYEFILNHTEMFSLTYYPKQGHTRVQLNVSQPLKLQAVWTGQWRDSKKGC